MFPPMPEPHEPEVIAAGPHAQSETRKLGVPDAVFTGIKRQFAADKIAVQKGPATSFARNGDHMAIGHTRTGSKSRGIPVIYGAQIAITSYHAAKRSRRFSC